MACLPTNKPVTTPGNGAANGHAARIACVRGNRRAARQDGVLSVAAPLNVKRQRRRNAMSKRLAARGGKRPATRQHDKLTARKNERARLLWRRRHE